MDLDSEVKERAQSFNLEVVSATISNYPLRQIDPKLRPRKMGPIEDDSNSEQMGGIDASIESDTLSPAEQMGGMDALMEVMQPNKGGDILIPSCVVKFLFINSIMNILIWNYRGALNPNFRSIVTGMVSSYSPAIMIISETKTSGERAKGIVDRLPLDGAIFANTIGLTRGLWFLWDFAQVDIAELSSTEQEIHVVVTPSYSNNPWLLSAIYASPRYVERHLLWENLEAISGLHSLSWVIVGDFNEVLMGEDKFEGRPVNINKALRFQECLDACRMIDIGYSGPRYTWSNNKLLIGLI